MGFKIRKTWLESCCSTSRQTQISNGELSSDYESVLFSKSITGAITVTGKAEFSEETY